MQILPNQADHNLLENIWKTQKQSELEPMDLTRRALPAPKLDAPLPGAEEVAEAFRSFLGWPKWCRVYAQAPLATLAISKMARATIGRAGVIWSAPGTGKPLNSSNAEPGVMILRTDWAENAVAVGAAAADAKHRNLLLVSDESLAGFRLAARGAMEKYEMPAKMVFYAPTLPSGRSAAFVAGVGEAPESGKEPGTKVLKEAYDLLTWLPEADLHKKSVALGKCFTTAFDFFKQKAGLKDEIAWDGPLSLPRISGKRMWAFSELAKEEGLILKELVLFDPTTTEEEFKQSVWPRLARALARLRVLPADATAPHGWQDAHERH